MATERVGSLTLSGRVLGLLVVRDLKVRYASSMLGYAWTVLEPLMMAGVYWFVFSFLINRSKFGGDPYIVFLLCGLLPWRWATGVISESTQALTKEAKLVRSTGIQREIWVLRVVGSKFCSEYLFALPVLIAFVIALRVPVSWRVVYEYPLAILLQTALTLGIGLFLASLSVLYRDLLRVIRVIIRVLFYTSPILYSVSIVQERVSGVIGNLYTFNPFVGILELYRQPLFPEEFSGWLVIGQAAVISVAWLALGVFVFRRLESTVLKEI